MMDVAGKKILVIGMARSGIAAAELLLHYGAVPLLSDVCPIESFCGKLDKLIAMGAENVIGFDQSSLVSRADMIIISPAVPLDSPIVNMARHLGVPLLGEFELGYRFDKGRKIAVTGTNGKTTTVSLLGDMLENACLSYSVAGNYGYPYARSVLEKPAVYATVLEVSSFQLETISLFHPETAVLLNITEDHMERHKSMCEYIRLKMRIFENQTITDFAIINADDPVITQSMMNIKSKVYFFSQEHAVDEGIYLEDEQIICRMEGEKRIICHVNEVRLKGRHNLENVMAASCAAYVNGVPLSAVQKTLREFSGVEHRIEYVDMINGIAYYNDSKSTNVNSAIQAIRTMTKDTVIILGGYDKQQDFSPLAKEMMSNLPIIAAVVMGQTASQIEESLLREGYTHVFRSDSLENAISTAAALLPSRGNVLLSPACASYDMFKDYEERGRLFKRYVNNLKNLRKELS